MKKTTLMKSLLAVMSAATMMAISSTSALATDESATPEVFNNDAVSSGATASCNVDIIIGEDSGGNTSGVPDPANDEGDRVYKVTVEWGSLNFTYNSGTWNPDTHLYDKEGDWDKKSETVTVINDSNWGITYTPSWAGSAGAKAVKNGVTATLSNIAATNIAAVEVGGTSTQGSFTVDISGTPSSNADFTLDTVNVAIAPQA